MAENFVVQVTVVVEIVVGAVVSVVSEGHLDDMAEGLQVTDARLASYCDC